MIAFFHIVCFLCILFTTSVNINRCISPFDENEGVEKTDKKKLKKWAIICLTKPNSPSIQIRNEEIALRIKPFAHFYDISVIFFSEMSISEKERTRWVSTFDSMAKVVVINTAGNGFHLKERYGYKYMCKFFALDVYDYLKGYDYYMRCDTDCYVKDLSYDLFRWVEKNRVEYGYAVRKLEAHGPTRQTLPIWTQKYMERCDIMPSAKMDKPISICFNFYNNFHIGSVRFFRRPDVQDFLLSVNRSGHILLNRWGDSTIQAYAVRLFMKPERIQLIPNFSYIHGSHSNRVINTFGDGSLTDVPQRLPPWSYSAIS